MTLDVFFLPTGRPFFDLVFAQTPKWPQPGEEVFARQFDTCIGGSFNIAYACHKLGLEVGLCAHLGTDFFSGAIRDALTKASMPTQFFIEHDKPMAAVTASISRFDERGFISYADPIPPFDPKQLPEHGTPHIVFVPGLPEDPPAIFDYIDSMKKAGSMMVFDCNHIDTTIQDEGVSGLISRMDIFLCNHTEAKKLTGLSVPERAAMALSALCPEVVVKMGNHGALAIEGGLVNREKAMRINAVDTTGAGDGFDAGYLYGFLEGMLVERRLRLGNVVGGVVASGIGGSINSPTLEEVLELEAKHYR